MKKIGKYIWQYKWRYVFAISALLIAETLDMLAPQLTRMVVDDVIVGRDFKIFKWLLLGYLGRWCMWWRGC